MFELQRDPIERTKRFRAVVKDVDDRAWRTVANMGLHRDSLGSCHAFWPVKQKILMDEFGIAWRTPAEMNPTVVFD